MTFSRTTRGALGWTAAISLTFLLPVLSGCARTGPGIAQTVRMARGGAGLQVGVWGVRDLQGLDGATSSEWPAFEGYFQRGLDLHLAMGNTIGL